MITETFLNSCFSLLLNKRSRIKKDLSLYRDILEILDFYQQKEKIEIPVSAQNKFECLVKICKMKLDNRTDDNIVDSLTMSGKFKHLSEFLNFKVGEEVREDVFQDNLRHVRLRKKLNGLLENYDSLSTILESVKEGSFESMDDLILDYESTIRQLFLNMMESNRCIEVEASSSLDLMKDNYSHVVDTIIKKFERKNTTPTGYSILDNEVMNGGFEPSRLYIFGGGSGAGKSTIMQNFIVNAATRDESFLLDGTPKNLKEGEIDKVFIYITLENTIDESLMRTYQPLFNVTSAQMITDIKQHGPDIIKTRITDHLKKSHSTIIMKYFRPYSISPFDLMGVLDDAVATFGPNKIKGLYIDYLDLLRTDMKYDLYRLELGHITSSLKTIAVEYEIPVITLTQLGRVIYEGITKSSQLTMNLVAEAIKKVEHADFVSLQAKNATDVKKIHMNIRKNRGGSSDVPLDWLVNLAMYKFISCKKMSNEKKASAANEDMHGFGGIGFDY